MTENFLKNMAKESFKRFQVAANSLAEKDLLSLCEGMEHLEAIDLPSNDFHIITEIKKQSPSMGRLAAESFDVEQQAMSFYRWRRKLAVGSNRALKIFGRVGGLTSCCRS
ncbi:MAG: hypothetical protein Ct9H300mP4_11450 [Gammaproteobacteria bacterium]|nr:MAG: hypothetical protein Ct9H300mP4_11450 [Gammaproteobacteria bacterium]